METPADLTFWAGIGTIVAGVTAGALGWLTRGRSAPEQSAAAIHGAAIIDSSIGERIAFALEALLEIERARDKRKEEERHDSEIETLRRGFEEQRREIAELKRAKR